MDRVVAHYAYLAERNDVVRVLGMSNIHKF
jgi:hypothetical protein